MAESELDTAVVTLQKIKKKQKKKKMGKKVYSVVSG